MRFIFLVFCMANVGCTLLGLGKNEKAQSPPKESDSLVRFSQNSNTYYPADRQYKRVTRSRMEEESQLQPQAGSMWVMEGQGAYLFSQNRTRREGDLLNIQIEGSAQKQVETKVAVIKKLLKQLEEEQEKQRQIDNPLLTNGGANGGANGGNLADNKTGGGERAPASVGGGSADKKETKEDALNIDLVPTRIVEKVGDGNYRIKGAQPFMIGKREYKVLVTGMIRSEDFNDQAPISSNKLLDPQFDVVSLRKNQR